MQKPTLYLETTIIGYLTNWPSSNITVESHRQVTHRWWNEHRDAYDLLISQMVVDEISEGDPTAIAERLALIEGLPLLPIDSAIASTASELVQIHALPPKALRDAIHISVCGHHNIAFLLTWNCTHIANPHILRLIRRHFGSANLSMPEVTTPEGLLGGQINAGSSS